MCCLLNWFRVCLQINRHMFCIWYRGRHLISSLLRYYTPEYVSKIFAKRDWLTSSKPPCGEGRSWLTSSKPPCGEGRSWLSSSKPPCGEGRSWLHENRLSQPLAVEPVQKNLNVDQKFFLKKWHKNGAGIWKFASSNSILTAIFNSNFAQLKLSHTWISEFLFLAVLIVKGWHGGKQVFLAWTSTRGFSCAKK